MPSLSSFALAFLTRSDCLLAYSGLRFPSSTYFMATSTSCGSFCAKDHAIIRLLATSAHAVSGLCSSPARWSLSPTPPDLIVTARTLEGVFFVTANHHGFVG